MSPEAPEGWAFAGTGTIRVVRGGYGTDEVASAYTRGEWMIVVREVVPGEWTAYIVHDRRGVLASRVAVTPADALRAAASWVAGEVTS